MLVFFKILNEGVVLALQELWASKLRTFLSILGITIGIFCIISVLVMVDSVERNVKQSFQRLGNDVLFVTNIPWDEDPTKNWWKYRKRPLPSYQEFKTIQDKSKLAANTAIRIIMMGQDLKYKNNTIENVMLAAASHEFGDIFNVEAEFGRYFSYFESQYGHNVVLLGHTLAAELFPNISDPVGKEIKVMGKKMTVIGVLKKEGASLLGDGFDSVAILPYHFARRYMDVNSKSGMPMIAIKVDENTAMEQATDELRGLLRAKRKLKPKEEDNFALNQQSLLMSAVDSVFGIINIAGWMIGLFSILVGGFGIANIMFVSVKERTGIIGIKKSFGAKNHFILFEFLIEAICLCFIGGMLGLLFVWGAAQVGNQYIDQFDLILSQNNILLGAFLSAAIGLISGFIPALSASQMNPVEAIRQNF